MVKHLAKARETRAQGRRRRRSMGRMRRVWKKKEGSAVMRVERYSFFPSRSDTSAA